MECIGVAICMAGMYGQAVFCLCTSDKDHCAAESLNFLSMFLL